MKGYHQRSNGKSTYLVYEKGMNVSNADRKQLWEKMSCVVWISCSQMK